jgi:pyrimidine operon attenuation protein/uracil phosphoribosyltransferase
MTTNRLFMQHEAVLGLIEGMAGVLQNRLAGRRISDPAMIGIHTGGVWVAEQLHRLLGIREPLGTLDISFYRDDFTRIGMNPQVRPSKVPFEVEDRHIILVDDVLQTGRTIRAALNEIFDFGRPASVLLVTLIERSGRELPIQPDVVGLEPPLAPSEHIRLNGPDPLSLEIAGNRASRHELAPRPEDG